MIAGRHGCSALVSVMFIALATICSLAGVARAQDAAPEYCDPPAYWRGEVNGWTFAPAVVSGSIVGYLGWVDPAITTSDDINTVWFQQEANGSWTTWGWQSGDFATAVDSIRASLGEPELWSCEDDITAKLGEDAVIVEGGESTDAGWVAAPALSELLVKDVLADTAVACDASSAVSWTLDQMVVRFTYEAETSLFGASSVTATQACVALCWGCWSTTTTPGAWSAWTLTGSTTTPAGVLVCNYSRTRTRTKSWTGLRFWGCGPCPAPVVQTQTQTGVARPVPAGAGCPAAPATTNSPGSWI